jgi:hypothetical protein
MTEGNSRDTTNEFVQFVSPGEGSGAAPEAQWVLALELVFAQMSQAAEPSRLLRASQKIIEGVALAGNRK